MHDTSTIVAIAILIVMMTAANAVSFQAGRRKGRLERPTTTPPSKARYEIRPSTVEGVYKFALTEFQEELKKGRGDSGSAKWGTAAGEWYDLESNSPVYATSFEIVRGRVPEDFLTYIYYYPK